MALTAAGMFHMRHARLRKWGAALLLTVIGAIACPPALHAESSNAVSTVAPEAFAQDLLRAYVQMQEQLHATRLALERDRAEAEAAARSNAETLAARMQSLEQTLTGERRREFEALQSSQRLMLVFAGVFAGVGLLAILLTAYVQARGLHSSPANSLSVLPSLNPPAPLAALGPGGGALLPLNAPENTGARLLAVIERLEKRIQDLEQMTNSAGAPAPAANTLPSPPPAAAANTTAQAQEKAAPARCAAQVDLLLGKGQVLLDLDRAEAALACFEAALRLDPGNAEALVKKGEAFERARQPDEAIACYDRAIAADHSFTMAYLHKGGLCNRLARHEEALKCYEAALKTQGEPER